MIINWAKKESTLDMVNLEAWCLNIRILMSSFTWVDFSHVYREHNRRADILSKEGLNLAPGHLLLTESFGNEIIGVDSSQLFYNMLILLQFISHDSLSYYQVLLSKLLQDTRVTLLAWIRFLGSCYFL